MPRLSSPRARRRLARLALGIVAVVAVAAAIALLPRGHAQHETFSDQPAVVAAPSPENVPASPGLRRRLTSETSAFIRTAVRRQHLNDSWPLVHPALRQGLSRREWLTGNIPVIPFPATGIVSVDLQWSYRDDVAFDVVLQPEPKSGLYRKTFTIEFRRVPAGKDGRWLVYSWVPKGVSDALVQDEHAAGVQAALEHTRGHRGISNVWILLPVVVIVSVFLLPLLLFLVERRRVRRAEEAHREAVAARYSSSSRPS